MRRFRLHPQHLLRQRWKSMHPFRPRVTRKRRYTWVAAFLLLSSVIVAYVYVSDPKRLKGMAETYLSSALDADVKIGQARLSIFQGLTLENVRVFTAKQTDPDALIFSARTLRLNYNLSSLLRGQVRATQIIATQPQIRLVQDIDSQKWNYQRLMRSSRKRTTSRPTKAAPPELPEIILRDGEIENAQVHDGHYAPLGTIWFEGRLGPEPDGKYTFTIQSRPGDTSAVGPQLMGWFDPAEGKAQLALRDLRFGPDMRAMLPEEVRQWCEAHQLSGALTIDNLSIAPRRNGGPPQFDVQMTVDGMNVNISPDQWRNKRENAAVQIIDHNLNTLGELGASIGPDSLIGTLTRFAHAPPLHLHITTGRLHFNDNGGIQIEKLIGDVEGSGFAIDGKISDYSPDSPFDLRFYTPAGSPLNFRANPKYIRSLPVPLQEVYDQFKPVGTCAFDVRVQRSEPDADVTLAGAVKIIDGAFVFDHFPYPLHNLRGDIRIGYDAAGQQQVNVLDVVGQGIAGSINANTLVHIKGLVGPFNRHCQAHLTIGGNDIASDPAVIAAMPRETQRALKLFDAQGHGEYPKFHGDFLCIVTRTPQTRYHWDVDVKLNVDRATGALVAFPYPVQNLALQLEVHENHLDITNAHMTKGNAHLRIDGRVSWNSHKEDGSGVSMQPVLKVHAENVLIDHDLLAALPKDRSEWIEQAGLGGQVDLNGNVFPNKKTGDIAFDFGVRLHDGELLRTPTGAHAIEALTAEGRLTDTSITAPHIIAQRGNAKLAGALAISWANKPPIVHFNCEATDLLLDNQLRAYLTPQARQTWDQVSPAGTLDVQAKYDSPDSIQLTLRPRQLSVTPAAMPWRMDQLTGAIIYNNGIVQLDGVTAQHGKTTLSLSGGGSNGNWKIHLGGKQLTIDQDFLRVAPKPLASLFHSLDLTGQFDFDFSRLIVNGDDFDFAVSLTARSAAMNTDLPITKINGSCDLAGHFQSGQMLDLTGNFDLDSLNIMGRTSSELTFKLKKTADDPMLKLYDLDGTVADGSLGGQMSFNVAPGVEDRYTLNLILRDADVTQLDPDPKSGIQGRLSASIDLEGLWSDPSTREGRGDVLVTGDHLYKIPILLGVSQIANLALPLNQPFTQGTAQYAVRGQTVVFDSIDLKASSMEMTGSGQMDFGTKKFDLLFTTNNPNWPKLPIINDLISAAQKELLQIRVTGTIQEPRVSAGLLSAVPTTIERVIGR
ncbi:MAG TPA: hypothetical protein VGG19_20835 [Tepidisphaeraceae bacterium]|jgi:hypothetical protein